jgi:hypothetical protein
VVEEVEDAEEIVVDLHEEAAAAELGSSCLVTECCQLWCNLQLDAQWDNRGRSQIGGIAHSGAQDLVMACCLRQDEEMAVEQMGNSVVTVPFELLPNRSSLHYMAVGRAPIRFEASSYTDDEDCEASELS